MIDYNVYIVRRKVNYTFCFFTRVSVLVVVVVVVVVLLLVVFIVVVVVVVGEVVVLVVVVVVVVVGCVSDGCDRNDSDHREDRPNVVVAVLAQMHITFGCFLEKSLSLSLYIYIYEAARSNNVFFWWLHVVRDSGHMWADFP